MGLVVVTDYVINQSYYSRITFLWELPACSAGCDEPASPVYVQPPTLSDQSMASSCNPANIRLNPRAPDPGLDPLPDTAAPFRLSPLRRGTHGGATRSGSRATYRFTGAARRHPHHSRENGRCIPTEQVYPGKSALPVRNRPSPSLPPTSCFHAPARRHPHRSRENGRPYSPTERVHQGECALPMRNRPSLPCLRHRVSMRRQAPSPLTAREWSPYSNRTG
jgi:hypothetical protein